MKRGSRILSLLLAGAIFLGSFDMSALAMEYGEMPVTEQELLRPEAQENFYEEENSEFSKEEQQLSEEEKSGFSEEEQQLSEEEKSGFSEEEQQLSEEEKSGFSEEERQPSKEGKPEVTEEESQTSGEEKLQLTEEEEQQSLKEMTHPVAEEMKQPSKVTKEAALQGNQTKVNHVADYDDLMEVQVEHVEPAEIKQKVYEVEELLEEEESVMPGFQPLSESYGNYWDMYSNHYFYNKFNQVEKDIWDAMEVLYSGYLEKNVDFSEKRTEYITVKSSDISWKRLYQLAVMFKYTHPQYYFLYNSLYMYNEETQTDYQVLAFGVYDAFVDGDERQTATNQIKNQLDIWVNQVNEKDTEEEKVKLIHDLICEKVSYNYYAYEQEIMAVEQEHFTQSAYSVFCMDQTVCCGYTLAFTWVCNAVGIEAIGVSAPGHAYNMVKVCGDWYNLDITWNDADDDRILYEYYLRNETNFVGADESTGTIGGSHSIDPEYEGLIPQRTLDSDSTYYEAKSLVPSQQKVATPVIQVTRGAKYSTVRITSTTPGAAIYYTLDGKEPSESKSKGYLYKTEFQINKDAKIKAIAVADQYQDSDVAEAVVSYIYYEEARGSWGSNVTWILEGNGVL
ncbi:MAG: chitobiase/beta-hexosaminidase C-terminal domain-containing protein, partial [Lachnospiraceae bacterium]|nr:chitobiase/beta-hexosaminidase C-terminal domain-containing protein [Lachnospiraceae bacterium]